MMGALRKRGPDRIVIAVLVAIVVALALSGAAESAPDGSASQGRFSSQRFAFSGSLPQGWSRSPKRLVPQLMPREVLSVGTAPMPVGGGGDCGREPVAAIARMGPGDALLSVQEYVVTARMRSRLGDTYPLLSTYSSPDRLGLRSYAGGRSKALSASQEQSPAPQDRRHWSATLPFRDQGRVFDALVYVKGPPSVERLEQVVSILGDLDFR
jgi:hypothetical protein